MTIIRELAPTISSKLPRGPLQSLSHIRSRVDELSRQSEAALRGPTDHSVRHSDVVLQNAEHLLGTSGVLNEHEAYVLVASCYLHDIGLLVGGHKAIRDFLLEPGEHEHYRSHARISGQLLLNRKLQESIGLPSPPAYLNSAIAQVCSAHANVERVKDLPRQIDITQPERGTGEHGAVLRLRFLGSLMMLADDLHLGRTRVNVQNVFHAMASLDWKLFWFSYSQVLEVKIGGLSIAVVFGRPSLMDPQGFEHQVVAPLLRYLNAQLEKLRPLLLEGDLQVPSPITHAVRTEPEALSVAVPFIDLLNTEERIRERSRRRQKAIQDKITQPGLIETGKLNNELIVLRRWGSYTPRMPNWNLPPGAQRTWQPSRGGGYLLAWRGVGIAIDPGYDFLRNLWEQEIQDGQTFELADINGIVCSHAHVDHTDDFESLVVLFERRRRHWRGAGAADPLRVYCSEGAHIKYERMMSINSFVSVTDLVATGSVDDHFLREHGIALECLRTRHHEIPWMRNNTGVAVKLTLSAGTDKMVLGYTGDSPYFDELEEFFREVDMLVLHFGNVGPEQGAEAEYDANHLGMNGCHDLIAGLSRRSCRLFVLDEFGEEEVGPDRLDVCQRLRDASGLDATAATLLPADIGLRVSLPNQQIFCQLCQRFVEPGRIAARTRMTDDGLEFVCDQH